MFSLNESTGLESGAVSEVRPDQGMNECGPNIAHRSASSTTLRDWSARTQLSDILRVIGAGDFDIPQAESVYFGTRRLRSGAPLVAAGQAFHALYVVMAGTLRATVPNPYGLEHVVAFPMTGDVVGLDALADCRHPTSVSALDDTCVAVLPYGDVQEIRRAMPQVEEALLRSFSTELRREHSAKSNMGALGAECRLVRFLLYLSERFATLGYSSKRFRLRMTREDIASYLGLSLETVCRSFTHLAQLGLIDVSRREIALLDLDELRAIESLRPGSGSRQSGPVKRANEKKSEGALPQTVH